MAVMRHHDLETFQLPGMTHRTLAGPAQGVHGLVMQCERWLSYDKTSINVPLRRCRSRH